MFAEYTRIGTTRIYSTASKQRLEGTIEMGKLSRERGVRTRARR